MTSCPASAPSVPLPRPSRRIHLPGISQSVIITRMEGRTPVPDKQKIADYAAHQATMVIFLSASLLEGLQAELLRGGYSADTPAAIVYKASWPEERTYTCTVGTLAETAQREGISKTALIVVGQVLGQAYDRSLLYHPAFTHAAARPLRTSSSTATISKGRRNHESRRLFLYPGRDGLRLPRRCPSPGRRLGRPSGIIEEIRRRPGGVLPFTPNLHDEAARAFEAARLVVFIGAAGIAVRTIAPFIRHKDLDPAVLVIDEKGQFVIPLLSGHIGGANAIARRLAEELQGQAVVTTATDVNALFAVDEWAARQACACLPWPTPRLSLQLCWRRALPVSTVTFPCKGRCRRAWSMPSTAMPVW